MNTHFSPEVLVSALAGNLSADDETQLNRHLDSCNMCNSELERMAGGADWCQEIASHFARDELDEITPMADRWSEIDFVVEHLEPADDPNALGRLGGYDVLEIIGRGGMGIVLKGYDPALKRCVAIKLLAPHLAQSSLAKKRFTREAQAAAAVVHPNVLAIHQVQASGRLPFLVMPLITGESLAQRISAKGTLELIEILRIGMQAAAGLAAAHEQGLIHRDVKPANILLEKGVDRAVLTDFGLARAADDEALTHWGIIAGTPQYMSPEQAKGEPVDGRSDLFSLGCVLYEMATGVSPFGANSTMATLRRLVDDAPQPLSSLNRELPPWFIAIVERLLEKDPAKRFSSATEVKELLEDCLAHVQQPSSVPLPAGIPAAKPRPSAGRLFGRGMGGRRFAVIVAFLFFAFGSAAFLMLTAEPSDISGEWTGDDWGQVILKKSGAGQYTGTYTDTYGKEPGKIELNWSRIERRYNGAWSEGKDRIGKISVRMVANEIRGAWTTNRKSEINPGTPALADLLWVRARHDRLDTIAVLHMAAERGRSGLSESAKKELRASLRSKILSEEKKNGTVFEKSLLGRSCAECHANSAWSRTGESKTIDNRAEWVFGPVIERTLNDVTIGTNSALNFETGAVVTPPDNVREFDAAMTWANSFRSDTSDVALAISAGTNRKADLVACWDGGGKGLRIIAGDALGAANWDASPKEVVETINDSDRQISEYVNTIPNFQDPKLMGFCNLWAAGKLPVTYYIKTRAGKYGILQITSMQDKPLKVTFRYKLLHWSDRKIRKTIKTIVTGGGWGESAEGVEVRLQSPQEKWHEGDDCKIKIEIRNKGKHWYSFSGLGSLALEIDGKTYPPRTWMLEKAVSQLPFDPNNKHYTFDVTLKDFGTDEIPVAQLTPGNHTFVVVLLDNGPTTGHLLSNEDGSNTVQIVADPVPGTSLVDTLDHTHPPLGVSNSLEMEIIEKNFPNVDSSKEPPTQKLTFGPIIEHTLNDISIGTNSMMNLENGNVLSPADNVRDFDAALNWSHSLDADLVACGDSGGHGLRIMRGLAIQPADWNASAKEIVDVIEDSERQLLEYKKNAPELQGPREVGFSNLWAVGRGSMVGTGATTFYIKARSGRMGVLQITGLQEDPRKVQFRYKLLMSEVGAKEALKSDGDDGTLWGEKREGVQVRLRSSQQNWSQGDDCKFKINIRNTGLRVLSTSGLASLALEIDGKPYPPRTWMLSGAIPILPFGPGKHYTFEFSLHDFGSDKTPLPQLAPGKHRIAAVLLDNSDASGRSLSQIVDREKALAVSNTVELTVLEKSKANIVPR
jgi:hypothetical protein